MKMLLALLLALFSYTSYAQAAWPRSPKTHKVEFQGSLPWPVSVKTEVQRQALVRRWYLAKLTDESPAAVDEAARTAGNPILLTYAALPNNIVLDYRNAEGVVTTLFSYRLKLIALPDRMQYDFSAFQWIAGEDVEANITFSLEEIIAANNANEKAALAALRKRLAVALAGW